MGYHALYKQFRIAMIGVGQLLLVATLDSFFGREIDSQPYYLLPVLYVAWRGGLGSALLVSPTSVAIFLGVDHFIWHHDYSGAAAFINALTSLSLYAMTSFLVSRLKDAVAREQELSRLRTDLLSMASQELGSTLEAMASALRDLRAKVPASNDETVRQFDNLENLRRSLRRTMEELVDHARVRSGAVGLEFQDVDLRPLIEEHLVRAQPLIERSHIEVLMDFTARTTQTRGNAEALGLAISNLLLNAIRFTPNQGLLTVGAKEIGGKIEFFIQHGAAALGGEARGVFNAFFRTLSGRKIETEYRTGLHLADQLIESHGSRLFIDTQPGRSTRASFRLKVARK